MGAVTDAIFWSHLALPLKVRDLWHFVCLLWDWVSSGEMKGLTKFGLMIFSGVKVCECDLELSMITASGRKQRNSRAYFGKKNFFSWKHLKRQTFSSLRVKNIENRNNPSYIVIKNAERASEVMYLPHSVPNSQAAGMQIWCWLPHIPNSMRQAMGGISDLLSKPLENSNVQNHFIFAELQ